MNINKPGAFDFGKVRYSVTSPLFDGELTFMYNDKGILVWFSNDSQMSDEQLTYLHRNFPTMDCLMIKLAGDSKTLVIKQTTQEVTFDQFWESYGLKADRQDAQKAFNKLTPDERIKAFENIPNYRYFLMLRPNQEKMYPATYLRGKYANDWKDMAKSLRATA